MISLVTSWDPRPGVMPAFFDALEDVRESFLGPVEVVVAIDRDFCHGEEPEVPSWALVVEAAGGQESAIWAGLAHASGHVFITIDPDMTRHLRVVDAIARKIASGCFDLVYTKRMGRHGLSWYRVAFSAIHRFLVSRMFGAGFDDVNSALVGLSSKARSHLLENFSPKSAYRVGMYMEFSSSFAELSLAPEERGDGFSSNYSFYRLVLLALSRLKALAHFYFFGRSRRS